MAKDKLKIILTDDDIDDRMFFEDAIEEINIASELKTFNHGQDLMSYLCNDCKELPNLIFLDLNMPIKNGMECLIDIRKTPKLQSIIVAIYSTSSSEEDIEEAFVNGANIYINKPTSFKELKKVIKKVLQINWQYQTSNLNKDNFLLRI
ncbi:MULTISPECIES: response regulator [Tenacibaculum]|uniref:Response regulator n=2 Tax=Tenacibaculum TaxID=104267 RepID=A0AAE9MNM3_9FLAO|nr:MULTISPECIES: response regulator [Tenacibaculum]GFD76097.1 response regulator [Tenacibaculum sp. KUL113]GFD93847.1 response regulator [Alteromonas sp. KUL154]GFE03433.1 response regulator [Alteromonas sp. KUL156]AZJ31242.1 response regulator [Tenacibaculum mesophilum]KAF9660293.1 response regulator [Tenacibaculum mesophilum]